MSLCVLGETGWERRPTGAGGLALCVRPATAAPAGETSAHLTRNPKDLPDSDAIQSFSCVFFPIKNSHYPCKPSSHTTVESGDAAAHLPLCWCESLLRIVGCKNKNIKNKRNHFLLSGVLLSYFCLHCYWWICWFKWHLRSHNQSTFVVQIILTVKLGFVLDALSKPNW